MPRSLRNRSEPSARRVKVLDNDGWTHITSTRATATQPRAPKPNDQLTPAEIPDGLTFDKLKEKYEWHKQRWLESQSWASVKEVLELNVSRMAGNIENCICIGLGSPSGLSRGGWVDRRSISMFQLVALESILGLFCTFTNVQFSPFLLENQGKKNADGYLPSVMACTTYVARENIKISGGVYAQDPIFNDMDKKLLKFIGLTVVEDPKAFSMVKTGTFLYAPGAERIHLVELLSQNPVILFANSLDSTHSAALEEATFQQFIDKKECLSLPEFESNPNAFYKATIYWQGAEKAGHSPV
ncbi:hypothetical protein LOZ66_000117 [Ophidiomyces ophidiicola]|nr:hypothetical protein LOZ66_000117 [Ophidiomyces ophidiicola]